MKLAEALQQRADLARRVSQLAGRLNQNAKKLKEHAPRTIAVLVQGAQSILFNSLLEIIQNKLQNLPYNASVFVLNEYDNGTQAACKIYYEQKPAGIIFLGGNPDSGKEEFDAIKVPCVLIANSPEDKDGTQTKNLSSVSTDDETASYFCTEYLIKNGHKKICVIGGELDQAWMYEGTCRHLWGIGRFCLGQQLNIEVVECDALKDFLLQSADNILYTYGAD